MMIFCLSIYLCVFKKGQRTRRRRSHAFTRRCHFAKTVHSIKLYI